MVFKNVFEKFGYRKYVFKVYRWWGLIYGVFCEWLSVFIGIWFNDNNCDVDIFRFLFD